MMTTPISTTPLQQLHYTNCKTSFGKILIHGPDAEKLLMLLCSNDISTIHSEGKTVYTGLLNERGGYESDVTVTRHAATGGYMLTTATSNVVRDMCWIEHQCDLYRKSCQGKETVGKDEMNVTMLDVTSMYGVLSVQGPSSRAILQSLSARPESMTNAEFPFGTSKRIDIQHTTVEAHRMSYVGELGFELWCLTDTAKNVYDALKNTGLVVDAGYYALESLRVEKGYRAWGHELDPDTLPRDVGLSFALSKDPTQIYIGKESVSKSNTSGGSEDDQRIVSFVLDDAKDSDVMLWGGESIVMNGEQYVGELTSATWGCETNCSVGMGMLKHSDVRMKGFLQNNSFSIHVGDRKCAAKATLKSPCPKRGVD